MFFNYCKNIALKSLDINLIKAFGFYYLILVVFSNILSKILVVSGYGTIIFGFLIIPASTAIFQTILIENIKNENYNKIPKLINKKKLLKKSWVVLRNKIIAGFLIFGGFLCFLVPGIILVKRYQYVSLISEDLLLNPGETLKLSRKISENNGWQVFNATWFSSVLAILPILIFLTLPNKSVYDFVSLIYVPWSSITIQTLILMPVYREYKKNIGTSDLIKI